MPTLGRASIPVSIVISLLLHGLGLWLLLRQPPIVPNQPPAQEEKRLTVSLAPPAAQSSSPPSSPAVAVAPPQKTIPQRRISKPAPRERQAPVVIARNTPEPALPPQPVAPPQESIPSSAPATDDMFSQLEAARKRRAEARTQAGLPPQEQQTNNDNRIALANIAGAVREGRRNREAEDGGVFQLRHLGYHDAAFLFRGWSTSANRDRTRLIEVKQGSYSDIQTAVVKKMIDIIREERNGDIVWESHRLGRQLTLSARPRDEAQLQQFLLQEFFPGYTSRNPAG